MKLLASIIPSIAFGTSDIPSRPEPNPASLWSGMISDSFTYGGKSYEASTEPHGPPQQRGPYHGMEGPPKPPGPFGSDRKPWDVMDHRPWHGKPGKPHWMADMSPEKMEYLKEMRERWDDPEYHKEMAEKWADPEYIKEFKESHSWLTDEKIEYIREKKEKMLDPEYRKEHGMGGPPGPPGPFGSDRKPWDVMDHRPWDAMGPWHGRGKPHWMADMSPEKMEYIKEKRERWDDPEYHKEQAEKWADPEYIKEFQENHSWATDEKIEYIREKKEKMLDPEYRKEHGKEMHGKWPHHSWRSDDHGKSHPWLSWITPDKMEKFKGMAEKFMQPGFIEKKMEKRRKFYEESEKSMLIAAGGLAGMKLLDQSTRGTIDTLARVGRELPEGTSCKSHFKMLWHSMEANLEASKYDPDAPLPHELLYSFFEVGVLSPHGSPTQSVVPFDNMKNVATEEIAAQLFSNEYHTEPNVPDFEFVANVLSPNIALTCTNTLKCALGKLGIDLDSLPMPYMNFETDNEFLDKSKPINLDDYPGLKELLTVTLRGEQIAPISLQFLPNNCYKKIGVDVSNFTTLSEALPYLHVALVFDIEKSLLVWPVCSPLDNGQIGKTWMKIKDDFRKEMATVESQEKSDEETDWWSKVHEPEIKPDEYKILQMAYGEIMDIQYRKSVEEFKAPCLYKNYPQKQCFTVDLCRKTGLFTAIPFDLLSLEDCLETYGEKCKSHYYGTIESGKLLKSVFIGAPLLCVENGSITNRGIIDFNETDFCSSTLGFAKGDYNMALLETHRVCVENYEKKEQFMLDVINSKKVNMH